MVYTHNLADKHETHLAVALHVIAALRALPPARRPLRLLGFEGWRALDWMRDSEQVRLDVSGRPELAAALAGVFDSQIAGGKRYDLAVLGRRRANATFFASHTLDRSDALAFALDLTPLALDDSLDIVDYVTGFIDRFKAEVAAGLRQRLGN